MSVEARKRLFTVEEYHRMGEAGSLGDRAVVSVQGPVVLDDYYEPLPDLAVLRPREDFYRAANPRQGDVLLLVEVADTSLRRDRREKLPKYAAIGIPETWLLDIAGRRLEVHRDPSPDGYRTTRIHAGGESVSPQAFPDVVVAVDDLIG